MQIRFAVAAAVPARAGDVLSVFLVAGAAELGAEPRIKVWDAVRSSKNRPAFSPVVFNETARSWSMTEYQAVGKDSRSPGQAMAYTHTPDPALAVDRVVRGTVVETALVHDMTYNHHDTMVVLEVIEQRALAAGEAWMPTRAV
jgi:hypothetical protein